MAQKARSRGFGPFCPIARALEVVGERWALLIVRDLLRGPMRFSELRRSLATITPKGLTRRLRELERDGIVERQSVEGRREVWYRLTAKGQALEPVIGALSIWGFQHALTPPRPNEAIHPELGVWGIAKLFEFLEIRLDGPVRWRFEFGDDEIFHITFADGVWRAGEGYRPADVIIMTEPRQWGEAMAGGIDQLPEHDRPEIRGAGHQVERFKRLFEVYRQAQ